MKKIIYIILCILPVLVNAQSTKYTISGTIKDGKTGEEVLGAQVRVKELKGVGASSNEYGFFSITLEKGNYTLAISSIGYKTVEQSIALTASQKINIALENIPRELKEVTVKSEKKNQNIQNAQMGVEKLDMKEISKIPVIFGERDLIKTLQLLPGVKSAGEGNAGFYVRGGSADQNLILLDEAPVYNASHLLGFFSTFNSDAIKDVALYKGDMPAHFGGRLSSVLDIKMNEGNDKKFHVGGGIGLISTKLFVEGPLKKEKSSFLVTGRRTYADLFLKLSSDTNLKQSKLYFYDLNAKANYRINKNNRLFVSGYFGRDVLGAGNSFGIDWGNATGTLRWNHVYSDRLFSNTSLIFSNYSYKISIKGGETEFSIKSKIRDWNVKHEFQYFPNPQHKLRFGVNVIHHTTTPGQVEASATSGINTTNVPSKYGVESALYVGDEWKISERFSMNLGMRISMFNVLGGDGNFYTYDSSGAVIDTKTYGKNEIVKTYINQEPRLGMSYSLNESSSIKAAYSRNVQNMHLISNSLATNPTDVWTGSTQNIKPELADQLSLGYYKNFKNNKYEFSIESYYKSLQNQIDYKNGADLNANDKLEGELLYGVGRAYGIEFFVKKKYGKFNGWIGYTLSKTERKIDGINNGNWYNAKQDRTHDISVVGIYDINNRWSLSATWVYYTGSAVTLAEQKYTLNGQQVFYYSSRNGYRFPSYHRLDFAATLYGKRTKKFESSWNFSVYNAYNRKNAYSIDVQASESDPTKTEAVMTYLFPIIPSVTYNFKF